MVISSHSIIKKQQNIMYSNKREIHKSYFLYDSEFLWKPTKFKRVKLINEENGVIMKL